MAERHTRMETWKALDLYRIAVSDKGRIRVDGDIIDALPPDKTHKRAYFKFKSPLTGRVISRDAPNLIWRAFRFPVHTDTRITPIDGNPANIHLDNLTWDYRDRVKPQKRRKLTNEKMRARVPAIIERMVRKWGYEDMQEPLEQAH